MFSTCDICGQKDHCSFYRNDISENILGLITLCKSCHSSNVEHFDCKMWKQASLFPEMEDIVGCKKKTKGSKGKGK